ncbi:hypothetical protein ANCCAN_30213 [Ancylostoma caninum]|uniref:Cleavage stimulation factor subunit 1 dimerisation domain-containing protein n=1 Tax=Ancylostoma caninum TaxID=29170 RepID=A0A368F1L7_ANCCA|nr:hypothetical protein ANCCAN_30213 [Ancylostoma caninum]
MKPDIKDRDYMYRLIIGQLFYDGHQQLALSLAQAIGCAAQPPPPSDKLFRLVSIAKQFVDDPESKDKQAMQFDVLSAGLDLEFDADLIPTSAEPCNYETIYLTSHKSACRTAAFNNDGMTQFLLFSNEEKETTYIRARIRRVRVSFSDVVAVKCAIDLTPTRKQLEK